MAETGTLNANNLQIPSVYSEIFYDNYKKFVLSSGRISGKTSILVALWWTRINKYPDLDIVVLQATATEIKDSIINEIEKFLVESGFDVGDDTRCEWYIPKAHNIIQRRGQQGATYFYPITDSKGGQRTRGITTPHKKSLVMFEEAQKNSDRSVVDNAIATFIRQLADNGKIVIVGNNETVGHWFVDFVEEKKIEEGWFYIYANCYDIWGLLNQQTHEMIEEFRKSNPTEFKRLYLGDIHANTSNVVFPQFTRENNYKRIKDIATQRIITLIVGVDHATANDTFAIVPVAVLEDGTTQTLEIAYDDPDETNVTLAPTEQCAILEEFMQFLDNKYGIADNQLQTLISVDGAAAPFIAQLRHLKRTAKNKRLWRLIDIRGFTRKKKDVNLGIIKNAFAYKVLTILNEGAYNWQHDLNKHRLAKEIEAQRYKNGKLNPAIKNDLCDALEYGLIPYYSNCYNLSFPVRKRDSNNHYQDITNLAKVR